MLVGEKVFTGGFDREESQLCGHQGADLYLDISLGYSNRYPVPR
jgi:hypothetical protein